MLEILSYGFMQKAFATGIMIALACSILGVFLVLKRYALMGDGIAHISFGGVATGLLFNIMPFFSALIFALIGSLGILKLKEKAHLYGDTAIGIISHASLGIGIFIASISRSFNVDMLSYLFGNILAIRDSEVILSILLSIIVLFVIILNYNDLFFISFDEESARTSGIKAGFLNTLLIMLTAITIVSSMRVVGLMLASSLLILPASSALQLKTSFKNTIAVSAMIAVSTVVAGLFVAYAFDFAASGTIVLMNAIVFISIILIKRMRAPLSLPA